MSTGPRINTTNFKRIEKLGAKTKRVVNQYKLPALQNQDSDESIDSSFDKCKLSIKTPTSPPPTEDTINNNEQTTIENEANEEGNVIEEKVEDTETPKTELDRKGSNASIGRKSSSDIAPDLVRCVDNYTEDELVAHRVKLEELQLKQKLMEEQNKKRKEMLSKALADRWVPRKYLLITVRITKTIRLNRKFLKNLQSTCSLISITSTERTTIKVIIKLDDYDLN